MKNTYNFLFIHIICATLVACSSHMTLSSITGGTQLTGDAVSVADANGPVGGQLTATMNNDDKYKMFHALDKAPGKSTQWVNAATNTTYTVTPIRKVVVNRNSLCREYNIVAKHGDQQQQLNGRACVLQDGGWHTV